MIIDRAVAATARLEASEVRAQAGHLREVARSLAVEGGLVLAALRRSRDECARARLLASEARAMQARNQQLRDEFRQEVAGRRGKRRVREAHFQIVVLSIGGVVWPSTGATLDVYHHGPEYDDAEAAQWEVHFAPVQPGPTVLTRNVSYLVEVEARDGRRFEGKAFLDHNAGPRWSLLDSDQPLHGLQAGDLT